MTYTNGIRKIFNSNMLPAGEHIDDLFPIVEASGYEALNFNGMIFILTKNNGWIKTPFVIKDFEA